MAQTIHKKADGLFYVEDGRFLGMAEAALFRLFGKMPEPKTAAGRCAMGEHEDEWVHFKALDSANQPTGGEILEPGVSALQALQEGGRTMGFTPAGNEVLSYVVLRANNGGAPLYVRRRAKVYFIPPKGMLTLGLNEAGTEYNQGRLVDGVREVSRDEIRQLLLLAADMI